MEFKDILIQRRAVNFFDPERPVSNEQIKKWLKWLPRRRPVLIYNPGAL
jgi:hypothetical protein